MRVTGPSESSVGTTNWVATGGGALCSGPTTESLKIKTKLKNKQKSVRIPDFGQTLDLQNQNIIDKKSDIRSIFDDFVHRNRWSEFWMIFDSTEGLELMNKVSNTK